MAVKHGIFVYENDTALSAPVLADSAVQCVIGAAPVWMLDNPADVTNKPILCTSATEAMEKLGYVDDFANYGLCQTMYITSNLYQVQPVVYINVLDVATMKNAATEVSLSTPVAARNVLTNDAVIKGTVAIVQGSTTLVKDTDYTLEYDNAGKLVINFISGSSFDSTVAATVTFNTAKISDVNNAAVIGSYNASTGVATGVEVIRYVYPKLGVIPTLLLAPNFSQNSAVGLALAAKAANINGVFKAIAVLDIDTAVATTYTDVNTVKNNAGYTSPFCWPIWPSFKVGTYVFAGSAVAAAQLAYTDAENGGVPRRGGSNRLLGVSGICLASGVEVLLDQDQASVVNGYGVTTAINLNGWRLWGSYTGAYPTTSDVKDMWLPVRRMFNWQANNFILTYFSKVDDPLNAILIESIVDSENIRLSAYVPDSLAGANIQYIASDNPVTDLLAGKIVFRQKIAPYTPAQEIDNILSYDTSLLTEALAGLV